MLSDVAENLLDETATDEARSVPASAARSRGEVDAASKLAEAVRLAIAALEREDARTHSLAAMCGGTLELLLSGMATHNSVDRLLEKLTARPKGNENMKHEFPDSQYPGYVGSHTCPRPR